MALYKFRIIIIIIIDATLRSPVVREAWAKHAGVISKTGRS